VSVVLLSIVLLSVVLLRLECSILVLANSTCDVNSKSAFKKIKS
jgi:hypothetical protein